MDYTALSKRIAAGFPDLSPQLRQAARYVLHRPDDVALMSMRGLAAEARVHPSTMLRLARAFGYPGYREFREPFQQRLRARPRGYVERARDLQKKGQLGELAGLLRGVVAADEANLRESFEANAVDAFATFTDVLSHSKRVFVLGLRSCFPVAYFFHYAYRMFRSNAVLMGERGGTVADELRDAGGNDVVLAISIEPYTMETVRAVEFAKSRGASVLVVTDSPVSPLAKRADATLLIHHDSPSFFGSVAAALAVVEALIVILVAQGGDKALEAIEESERQLARFEAYWQGVVADAGGSATRRAGTR